MVELCFQAIFSIGYPTPLTRVNAQQSCTCTQGAMPYKLEDPAWFDQVSPNLLRNRALRSYLGLYASKDLPEVVKLTMLYGVICLGKAFPGAILSIEQLRHTLAAGLCMALNLCMPRTSTCRMLALCGVCNPEPLLPPFNLTITQFAAIGPHNSKALVPRICSH